MSSDHPITPPPELVREWAEDSPGLTAHPFSIATQAARWGADQELEACIREIQSCYGGGARLRAARRPKPPSLKEQALEVLGGLEKRRDLQCNLATIRRALEALPE
jgi:hypothetical protein